MIMSSVYVQYNWHEKIAKVEIFPTYIFDR